mgnify:CR=1 FL=1
MKLSELVIGKEYAIVPSWEYASKQQRDVANVRPNDVVKGELISLDKYDYQPSLRPTTPDNFTLAKAGERSVGVLVKGTLSDGQEHYWTSRLADILAEYSSLEPRWAQEKLDQEKAEREENERRDRAQRHQQNVYAEVERCRNSVIQTVKDLLGNGNDVEVSYTGYGETTRGVVSLSLNEFEKLIELAYTGKEN